MTDKERAQRFYELINGGWFGDYEESTYRRFLAVRELENITGKQFNNTEDFHREVEAFLANESLAGADLLKLRKSMNLKQRSMAIKMGIPRTEISEMEHGRKPLNKKTLAFMRKNLNLPYALAQ